MPPRLCANAPLSPGDWLDLYWYVERLTPATNPGPLKLARAQCRDTMTWRAKLCCGIDCGEFSARFERMAVGKANADGSVMDI